MSTATASASNGPATAGSTTASRDEDYVTDQVKIYSDEGDGENSEHLKSMDLHDIKTELERDAEKAETPKTAGDASNSPTFADGTSSVATTSSALPQASIRPVIHHPTAMVYANGSAVPFMIPPFAAAAAAASGSPLYPVMRPVKVESTDWKGSQASGGQLSIPTFSYPTGFLPVDQTGLRPAYPFMTIPPGQYVTQMPYQTQFTTLGQSMAPNATVQPNSGGMLTAQVKEKKPHIKKPLNAFMLFMKQKRADVIKECTLKESAAINQILGKMWHALDRSEQAKYYEMAREERAKHMQMYPGWSARDNYAIHKKRRKRKVKQADGKGENSVEDKKKEVEEKESLGGGTGGLSLVSSPPGPGPLALGSTAPSLSITSQQQSHQQHQQQQQRSEDEDSDMNNRKCRARFGLEQQHMWCSPCRRKKKCIRYSMEEEEHTNKEGVLEIEDEVLVESGGGMAAGGSAEASAVMISQAKASHNSQHAEDELPHLYRHHDIPLTLRTIPT